MIVTMKDVLHAPLTSIDEQANGEQGRIGVDYDEINVQQQTRVEPTNIGRPKKI